MMVFRKQIILVILQSGGSSMENKEDYFEHFTNNSIPTPADQEDITPTDLLSEAVEQIIDKLAGEAADE